jgi:hypothetical protein
VGRVACAQSESTCGGSPMAGLLVPSLSPPMGGLPEPMPMGHLCLHGWVACDQSRVACV